MSEATAPEEVVTTPVEAVADIEVNDPVELEAEEAAPTPSPEPEPVKQRTWDDVYDDLRNDRPIPPSEMREVQRREALQQKAVADRQAEDERITKLFPTQKDAALKALAEFTGVSDLNSTEGLALKYKLNEVFDPLEKDARAAFTTPLLKTVGSQLWEAAGRTPEAHRIISSLSPDQLIPAAIEIGRNLGMAPPNLASTDDLTKWTEGGKVDGKKLITVEDAQKKVDHVLEVERKARGETTAPGPSGRTRPAQAGKYTLAQIDAMPMSEWNALGDHETRARILDDAHRMAGR